MYLILETSYKKYNVNLIDTFFYILERLKQNNIYISLGQVHDIIEMMIQEYEAEIVIT